MESIDRFEKLGRLVLWLVISGVLVIAFAVVPLKLVKRSQAEFELRERLSAAEENLVKALEPAKPSIEVLTLKSMGAMLRGLNHSDAIGRVWFTNVSPREGVLCAVGSAKNDTSGDAAESLAACTEVTPYSSGKIELTFAGSELSTTCPGGTGCTFSLADAPVWTSAE